MAEETVSAKDFIAQVRSALERGRISAEWSATLIRQARQASTNGQMPASELTRLGALYEQALNGARVPRNDMISLEDYRESVQAYVDGGNISQLQADRLMIRAANAANGGFLTTEQWTRLTNALQQAVTRGPREPEPEDGGEAGPEDPPVEPPADPGDPFTNPESPPDSTLPEGMEWFWDGEKWVVQPVDPGSPSGEEAARRDAKEILKEMLKRVGLYEEGSDNGFFNDLDRLIREWGTNEDIIAIKIRETDAYKARFRGNQLRVANGYNAISEAEYLSTEDAIRSIMRARGMTDGFQTRDYLASLIGNDVAATEVDDRIGQAQRVLENADPNVVTSLQRLYGVQASDLYGYVLDAETAIADIYRRVNASLSANAAQQVGISVGVGTAEQIGDMTGGNEQVLRPTMERVASLAESSRRLGRIDADSAVSDEEVLQSEFGLNQSASDRVRKLQSRERARFSGTSGAYARTLGGSSY